MNGVAQVGGKRRNPAASGKIIADDCDSTGGAGRGETAIGGTSVSKLIDSTSIRDRTSEIGCIFGNDIRFLYSRLARELLLD